MIIRKSNERGHASHGWLDSYHTFSFGDYYDPRWQSFRSLRVINDDLIMPGSGFGKHPHRDMEIISYIAGGALQHKDSMGNGRILRTDEFQYMAAGKGVEHSEFNPSSEEPTRLIQIWIQPDRKGVEPRYAEKQMAGAAAGKLHLVASKHGRQDSMAIHQDADLWFARLLPGQSLTHDIAASRHVWLHVVEGGLTANGTPLLGGDALGTNEIERLSLSATRDSKILLFELN